MPSARDVIAALLGGTSGALTGYVQGKVLKSDMKAKQAAAMPEIAKARDWAATQPDPESAIRAAMEYQAVRSPYTFGTAGTANYSGLFGPKTGGPPITKRQIPGTVGRERAPTKTEEFKGAMKRAKEAIDKGVEPDPADRIIIDNYKLGL